VGTGSDMNSDTLLALSGAIGLSAAALTGAVWGSPAVTASAHWLLR